MTCPAFKFDDHAAPAADPGYPVTKARPDDESTGESLFETFVDEIDVWARRALASNGFGDYL